MNAHHPTLSPHPEEARRAVSKDAPARTETSFETKPAASPQDEGWRDTSPAYNYAYLDEQTKRMIRRALLKAVAVPGYQVPFGSREMPLARGWGTGGIQVTAAIIGPDDTLKVIDQGADDTTNAVSIRRFFEKTADARTTEATERATIIQTRHRIPEAPLQAGQIIVYQVPQPEPLRKLEPREAETRKMHAWAEYGLMQVKLYENIARFGEVTTTYDYPVMINGRYIMAPSPIPKFDNPKMHMSPALQLFGAGREKRIYALPPHTSVRSLDFEDHPFRIQSWSEPCALCAATDSYLDEVVIDDQGSRMFVCSDSHHCETRRAAGHRGTMLGDAAASGLVDTSSSTVIPGDRRETRDPFRNPTEQGSGMDPGSALRSARDDGAKVEAGAKS